MRSKIDRFTAGFMLFRDITIHLQASKKVTSKSKNQWKINWFLLFWGPKKWQFAASTMMATNTKSLKIHWFLWHFRLKRSFFEDKIIPKNDQNWTPKKLTFIYKSLSETQISMSEIMHRSQASFSTCETEKPYKNNVFCTILVVTKAKMLKTHWFYKVFGRFGGPKAMRRQTMP